MPTRTAFPGTISAGASISAANNNRLPGGWLALDEDTASEVTSSTTELTLHTLSVPVGANRKLRIHFHTPKVTITVASDDFAFRIYYDGTAIQRLTCKRSSTQTEDGVNFVGTVNTTTSGNKTIAVTLQRASGTGTCTLTPAAVAPTFMLVEDIGPSS